MRDALIILIPFAIIIAVSMIDTTRIIDGSQEVPLSSNAAKAGRRIDFTFAEFRDVCPLDGSLVEIAPNTEVRFDRDRFVVEFYGNPIATVRDDRITIDTHGYTTETVCRRLDALARHLGWEVHRVPVDDTAALITLIPVGSNNGWAYYPGITLGRDGLLVIPSGASVR